MGVGLDLVEAQGEPAGVLGPSLEVVDLEQAPAGLRAVRIEAQGLDPGGLGLVQPPQPEQGLPAPERDQGPHAGRGMVDAVDVRQGVAHRRQRGLAAFILGRRGAIQEDLGDQEVGRRASGVRPQGRADDRLGLVEPARLGQRDGRLRVRARAEERPGRRRPAR